MSNNSKHTDHYKIALCAGIIEQHHIHWIEDFEYWTKFYSISDYINASEYNEYVDNGMLDEIKNIPELKELKRYIDHCVFSYNLILEPRPLPNIYGV